jgi:sugar phosphate isomerase/epimerase
VSEEPKDVEQPQLSRRDFLGALGALALGPGMMEANRPIARSPNYLTRIGIQLYTVREILQQDFEGTLAALAGIGITEVELYSGLYERKAKDIRAILDRHGLSAPSGHVGLPDLTDTLQQTIDNARALGQQYVVVASFPAEMHTVAGYTGAARALNAAGPKLRAAGLTLGFHNHADEFVPLEGERGPSGAPRIGYDILLEQTDPSHVVMELDIYWIRKGRRDPLDYFARYPGRFHMLHVKDMAADGSMVDVGAGTTDWKAIFRQAHAAGVRHYFLEHDEPKDPIAFARTGYQYLRSIRL